MSWNLSPAEYELTVEKIDKINARAAKRGFTGQIALTAEPVTTWSYVAADLDGTAIATVTSPGMPGEAPQPPAGDVVGLWVSYLSYQVDLGGQAPCYGGWAFVATLDWETTGGGEPIVRTVPDTEFTVNRDGLRPGWCDHCKTNRRRKDTYLVVNTATGEQMQVGSSCIKDFLGWTGRPVLLFLDDITKDLDLLGCGGWGASSDTDVDTVLAVAWAAVQTFGYVRSGDYSATPTQQVVRDFLFTSSASGKIVRQALAPHLSAARAKAAQCRAFILSDEFAGESDYVANLKALAAAESIGHRGIGILASAPQAWARHQEQTLIRKAKAEKPSFHFGQVGDKVEFTGRIESIRYSENNFGYTTTTTTIYRLRAEDGRIVTWFSSNGALGDDEGVTVTIKGTIKAHTVWQDVPETVLTRCKRLSPVPA